MNWAIAKSAPTLLISDTGRIVRMASSRRHYNSWLALPELELSPRRVGSGYLGVQIKLHGSRVEHYVHRLVAEAFVPGWFDGAEVNHIDGNKANNNASNLEWVSHSQNHQHAVRVGLNPKAKLTPDQVLAIRNELESGRTRKEIGASYGVSLQAIKDIRSNRTWSWIQ